MSTTFDTLVDKVRTCSTEEKEELRFLLERALVEDRRDEILANYRRSRNECRRGKLKFSAKIIQLEKSLIEP